LETRELVARLAGVRVRNSVIPLQSEQLVAQAISGIPSNFLNVLHVGLWAFVIPFVGFFALAQGRAWIDTIFDWTPSEHVETMLGFIAELNARLGGYIRGVILESVCVGVITIIGLWLLGIDGAVLIGVITGIVNVVPFMAPVIGGTLAIAAGYFQGKAVAVLLSVLLLYILVRLFDDMVLVPFVVGSQVQLHPVAILLAVLTGIELAGVLGLLFAVPITVILKVVLGVFLRSQREGPSLKHHDILS
jgi:predicted PurR-regulated permease PerM